MPRYIDADAILSKLRDVATDEKQDGLIKVLLLIAIEEIEKEPTADVVPRAEVDRLQSAYTEQNKALAKYIESSADLVSHAKAEVAREIFEEIDAIKKEYARGNIDGNELYIHLYRLEKKYTEEQI
jgi:hypothetical protein